MNNRLIANHISYLTKTSTVSKTGKRTGVLTWVTTTLLLHATAAIADDYTVPAEYNRAPLSELTPLEILKAHRGNKTLSSAVGTALKLDSFNTNNQIIPQDSSLNSNNSTAPVIKSKLNQDIDSLNYTAMPLDWALSNPLPKKTLRVVGVADPSIIFEKEKYTFGLGYSLAGDLAYALKLNYNFKAVKNNAAALKALKNGDADIAITILDNAKLKHSSLDSVALNCSDKSFKTYGNNTNLNFSFSPKSSLLKTASANFLCQGEQKARTQNLFEMYDQSANKNLNNTKIFYKQTLTQRLPLMKPTFQQYAKQFNLDWQLLVAVGFQESLLSAEAVSPTGVTGVMMLTQATASDMGVKNRNDPIESIYGGSRYLALLLNHYNDLPKPDRLWFSLAAYNMGMQNVNSIRTKLGQQKLNPNSWNNFYHYLALNQNKNSQFTQCMQYVRRIRSYLEMIKTDKQLKQI